MNPLKKRARLMFEALEDRSVPAILLQFSGGNLTGIFGVPAGNVDLTAAAADTLNVMENGNDLGTYLVNGNLNVSLGNTIQSLTHTLDLTAGALSGSVSLTIGSSTMTTTVAVTGAGVVGADDIGGNLSITTGNGVDNVTVDANVAGSVTINTAASSDTLLIGNAVAAAIGGNLTVTNVNTFTLGTTSATVGGRLTLNTASEALTGTYNLTANSSVAGGAYLTLGGGDDAVTLAGSVLSYVTVNLGNAGANGNTFTASGTIASNLSLTAGSGTDNATLSGTLLGNLTANLGNGTNSLTLGGTILGTSISFRGGNQVDTLSVANLAAPGARLSAYMQNGNDVINIDFTNSLFAYGYIDGGFGVDTYNPTGVTMFPFILRNIP